MRKHWLYLFFWSGTLALGIIRASGADQVAHAQNIDTLRAGFAQPPEGALPRVWWHWMGGNITKEGIELDLDWMHRAGIGGFQAFEGTMLTPEVVKPPVTYMSPEWKDAFAYAVSVGKTYGMEMAVASSPGWSETGGPWVQPEHAMKKIVWSVTRIHGGTPFHGKLAKPPATVGPFQNVPATVSAISPTPTFAEFYADSEVIAFRAPASEVSGNSLLPKITVSSGNIDAALLSDGDLVRSVQLPAAPAGQIAWIQYDFGHSQMLHAISLAMAPTRAAGAGANVTPILAASENGVDFRPVCRVESLRHGGAPRGNVTQTTVAFAPLAARYFRIGWKTPEPSTDVRIPSNYQIAELVLHPGARVNHFEEKVGFSTANDLTLLPTPNVMPGSAIAKNDVIRLTDKLRPDGTLDWTPPGNNDWIVLRFGASLTGAKDSPAPPEATGLEVDKFDHLAVHEYLEHYFIFFKSLIPNDANGHQGLQFVVNDSWEAGNQTWTDDMVPKFTELRGYDPRPWMPVLAGYVVESAEASDRFLWDFRHTIGNLIVHEHYGEIDAFLRAHSLGRYSESHEDFRAFVGDGMEVKRDSQVPMGAMWPVKPHVYTTAHHYDADDRESASVAHIYGQNIAAAESLTTCDPSTAWAWTPATLRPTADQEFLNGINRIVIHESALQPLVDKMPGMTLGPCGQWFNRNETWAEQAHAWTTYLARNSFLLQQGKFVADLLYFYGEDTNITARFSDSAPAIPAGYNFDYVNADALIHTFGVTNGHLSTRSGMSYRVLVLDDQNRYISLPVLRALHKLVEQGAIIAGNKPVATPSLVDDPAEFSRLNDELFGTGQGMHPMGRGRVYAGTSPADVLKALNIEPDFVYDNQASGPHVQFIHRKLANGEVYFVDNRSDRESAITVSFRVAGKTPELWHSDSGRVEPASYTIVNGRTSVPLHMEAWGSVFVVFRKAATKRSFTLPQRAETLLTTLEGPWSVAFQPNRGAPASITMDALSSWSDASDDGVKYFSGTATYSRTVQISPEWLAKRSAIWLDLGDAANLATVVVNGQELDTLWHKPFRAKITAALKPGANKITIKVTNSWINRLVGDRQPNAAVKYTFTTWSAYGKDTPLPPSGLLGPVTIVRQAQ